MTSRDVDDVLRRYMAPELALLGAGPLPAPPRLPREGRETTRPGKERRS